MVVGLGTGSTVYYSLERIDKKLKSGALTNIRVIPCSEHIKNECISRGIPVTTLSDPSCVGVNIFIDGVDEIDKDFNTVKGRSGSFFREKLVKSSAAKTVIVCDNSKLTRVLGPGAPVPVEVVPYSHEFTCRRIESLPALQGCRAIIRRGSLTNTTSDGMSISVTDNGNFIADLYFDGPLSKIEEAIQELDTTTGVVEHGLNSRWENANVVFLIATDHGVRLASPLDESTPIWWDEMQTKRPLARESVDNRNPPPIV